MPIRGGRRPKEKGIPPSTSSLVLGVLRCESTDVYGCMQAACSMQVAYERMQLAFVDSLSSSVTNNYLLGQYFTMVDVDAIAVAGAIYVH